MNRSEDLDLAANVGVDANYTHSKLSTEDLLKGTTLQLGLLYGVKFQ